MDVVQKLNCHCYFGGIECRDFFAKASLSSEIREYFTSRTIVQLTLCQHVVIIQNIIRVPQKRLPYQHVQALLIRERRDQGGDERVVNDRCEGLALVAHMFHLLEFNHFPVAISTSYSSPRATLDKVALTVRLSQNFQRINFVLVLLVL